MRQVFKIDFEYCADDKGYTAEQLLALLREACGNEYDIIWHSVMEVKNGTVT